MSILEFMSNNPWLTFFLACIAGETIRRSVKYAKGIPDAPAQCPRCNHTLDDGDES